MTPRVLVLGVVAAAAAWTGGAAETATDPKPTKPTNVVRPRIVGAPRAGVPLEATPGTWTPSSPVHYTYRWFRCPAGGAECTRIARATDRSYTPASVDVGATLRVTVTAANAAGSGRATSLKSRVVRVGRSGLVVALWHMNETAGTMMHDAKGAHDGTLHDVTPGVPGVTGTAFGFNGYSSYALVPAASDLNAGTANLTLTIRLKTTQIPPPRPGDADLIRKGSHLDGAQYKIELQHSGQVSCAFAGSAHYSQLIAGPPVNDGGWHKIQCIKAPTAIQLVVDGKVFTKPANVGAIANPAAPVVIGAHFPGDWYSGTLDETSIRIG